MRNQKKKVERDNEICREFHKYIKKAKALTSCFFFFFGLLFTKVQKLKEYQTHFSSFAQQIREKKKQKEKHHGCFTKLIHFIFSFFEINS